LNWLGINVSTKKHHIIVNDLVVDVVRKKNKNLHLSVYPPNGRVRVSAPMHIDDEAIQLAVISRLAWIRRQQAKFEGQERQSAREFVSGESHYFRGNRYLLDVIYHDAPPKVVLNSNYRLALIIRPGSDTSKRERVLMHWYRQQLKEVIPPLVKKWEDVIGVKVAEWRIKKMKTRWGTCNIEQRRIWLNLELAKKSTRCLEYIIVHELAHLLERYHNRHFVELMDQFMPQWRLLRDELNQAPLANEDWDY
jgi:predicted metal-dependent hydrolase